MYSLSVRINSIFFFFGICLTILGVFNVLTTILIKRIPKVNKFSFKSTSLYNNPYTKIQHSSGEMEMDIDFEPCYNWNTNLIFAWISATYDNGNKRNKGNTTVTIWDNIMKRDNVDSHHFINEKQLLEYPLISKNFDLSNKDIYLELHWEHMPVFGPILKKSIPLGNYKVRKDKTKPTKREIEREVGYDDL